MTLENLMVFFAAGAALGPLFAGLIAPSGWNNVFYMLISADVLACLVRRYFITLPAPTCSLAIDGGLNAELKIQLFVVLFVSSFCPGLSSRRPRVGGETVLP